MGKISSEKKVFSEYPSNLKVLAIDTDPIVLEFIKKVCNEYCYEVITCTESLSAAIILQEKKSTIDLILMEVHMPHMDGYEFLLTTQEINVPKLMMSFDDSKKSVMKTIKLGACDYMIKPLHEDRLRNMWTHVVRKSMNEDKMRKNIRNSLEDDNQNSRFVFSSSDEISREVGNAGQSKKPRVVWTTDLHGKFVKAVNQLGLENAVPNKIQQLMNTPHLTRNHVASHLQVSFLVHLIFHSCICSK
ncbi:hypothetical protein LR48_Vigan08g209500 [Vigna angularis]|uniref:Response regulatory domain-containing protein n=1 Tax=Phaseolus angularis TaxID=3914 RepID=A0A0L9V8E5_PHAAN|nr:hypothetical protein LR48_Vigan08g209500 [Vigna angularis]